MKSRRYLVLFPILLLFLAITVRVTSSDQTWVALTPVAFEMKVPTDIAERITVQDQKGNVSPGSLEQAYKDGAVAVVTLSYQPIEGEKAWFMTAYFFNETDLDKTIFSDEVPPYGLKLITRDGMALSVIGPQESIYEPNSHDGKNVTKLYDILYDADSYRFIG
jgi:hypothetical protein